MLPPLFPLQHHSRSHSTPHAHAGHPKREVPPFHLTKERQGQTGPGHADRVAQCNGPPVDINNLPVQFQRPLDRKILTAKASLISKSSMSESESLARSKAFGIASAGPIPMRCGSTPTKA